MSWQPRLNAECKKQKRTPKGNHIFSFYTFLLVRVKMGWHRKNQLPGAPPKWVKSKSFVTCPKMLSFGEVKVDQFKFMVDAALVIIC